MNNNEAIVCTVILICFVLFLFLKQRRDKSNIIDEKEGSFVRSLADGSEKIVELEGAKKESFDKKREEKLPSLLYIPPEMTLNENESDTFSDDKYKTEIRKIYGSHIIDSDSEYDRVADEGDHPLSTQLIGVSSDYKKNGIQPSSSASNSGNNTIIIYQYHIKTKKWVCPYCELENPEWTNICQVCGEIYKRIR